MPSVTKATKPKVSWLFLGIMALVGWVLFFDGFTVLGQILTPEAPKTIYQTATAGPTSNAIGIELPTALIRPTRQIAQSTTTPNTVMPPTSTVTSGALPTATPQATPECVLATWHDGSQSCSDGRPIDAAHSQPAYCTPVLNIDGTATCTNGHDAGVVDWADPEVAAEPVNTPWPAEPPVGAMWSATLESNGSTCITVRFADEHTQTACTKPGIRLDADDTKFVARMILDGRIPPGAGVPNG